MPNEPTQSTTPPACVLDRPVVPLLERLRDEADLCRHEGATDIARLLDEAAEEMHNLAWALSLPGFDRMATDEQEAEHQAGVQRVNDVLAEMERRKAEHDAMVRDAERYRFIRDADKSDELTPELALYAMEALDDYVDEAMREYEKRHNAALTGSQQR